MDAMVPSLLLQPLVENAIYHGIERLPHGGEVLISASLDQGVINLSVTNPVIDSAISNASNAKSTHEGHQLALDNIKQRLDLAWPGQARVMVDNAPGRYCVTLTFPYSKRDE
jgi:two-component system sensor histidine kinase AlgZ